MAVLWGIVFTTAMHSLTLGICMGIIYVIANPEHVKLLPDGAVRILVTADLETIQNRFTARMHGTLTVLWGIVFTQSMHSLVLGICMGLLMGIAFGLFDSDKGGKEDE